MSRRWIGALAALPLVAACASSPMTPPQALADLAPTGKLRAAINFGNPLLAVREPATGEPTGISVDIARELARRLGVPLEIVTYDAAGKVVEGLRANAWDIAFLAIDPARAVDIAYTAPYVVIEGFYLVAQASPIRSNADVDRAGVRVVVGKGSAYDLFLSRELKAATIVRAPTSQAVTDTLVGERLDVAAGVRQQMEADARRVPGLRLLDACFMVINQAVGTPKARGAAGARFLREFIEGLKASGFVAHSLASHRVEGVGLAPLQAP